MSQLCRFERHVDIESYSLTCHVSYVHHALCRTCRSHRHLTAPQWPHSQPTCLTRSALFTAPPVLLYPKWLICEIQTKLETTATHTYEEPGEKTVLIKVIDILGNDTTKAVKVEVR